MPSVSSTMFTSSPSSMVPSYRSSISTSPSIDKPYYRSNNYISSTIRTTIGDKTTEYKSRYSDYDGKRDRKTSLVEYTRSSRAPSVTDSDSGISRYRNERSESRSRDISNTRSESSKSLTEQSRNARRNVLTATALANCTNELYEKYSPANYIPLTQRIAMQQQNRGEIARSKSISNDIGRPPAPDARGLRKPLRFNSTTGSSVNERIERRSYKESSPTPSYSKRNSLSNGARDTNGNEVPPSVSEIRKRFDNKMTVTKLPTNDPNRYNSKNSVDSYMNQLKSCENGTGYTKVVTKDDRPVPIHLPSEKNGARSRSSSVDVSITKTLSEPNTYAKPSPERNDISVSLTAKLPDRLASIKNQLDPNNPIGKILEKSTVIQVENGDNESKKTDSKQDIRNGIEKQVRTPNHTSNFASYIQISQPIVSGLPNNDEPVTNGVKESDKLKYIDSQDDNTPIDDVESPSGTGFENKTFEHENFLKKRNGDLDYKKEDEAKPMETSTESTISDITEDGSPETPNSRRKLDLKDYDDIETELSSGRGAGGLRRSVEKNDVADRSSQTCGLNGLRNIGNTCFMNSVVQCLSNTKPLLEYVVNDQYTHDINTTLSPMKGALIKAFASVIKELWRSGERDSVVNTTTLKSQIQRFAPRFMGYSQQDAQEFLRYLLEGLHEDVNRVTVKPKPILTEIDDNLSDAAKAAEAWHRYLRMEDSKVSEIFVGQLKSTLRCTHCENDSVTFDPFWDLSLPIPSRTGNLKIQQCLQHFTKEEEMDGDEKPTCSKCGVRRKCLKWFTVQKFPQVLVLHLKRFSPTERFRGKLNCTVEFPLKQLDMSSYAANKDNVLYNLCAVSNHSGTTYSGHYTAYCKHPYTGDWFEYNDSRVSPINPRNVVSSEAYVLFYERQS